MKNVLFATTVVISTLGFVPLVGSPAAMAQTSFVTSVRTNDLDLTTTVGQKKLKLRLMHAVSELCPVGAKCRAPTLKRAYQEADALIASANNNRAVR